MAEDNANNKGGSGTDKSLENKGGNQSGTEGGQTDWKAKFEESQKQLDQITQERNHLRNKNSELTEQLTKVTQEKETAQNEVSDLKATQERTAKQQAAQSKQNEILAKYSDATKELAKKLGIELGDAEDEAAVKEFTEKMDALNAQAGQSGDKGNGTPPPPPVSSNNTHTEDGGAKSNTGGEKLEDLEDRVSGVKF